MIIQYSISEESVNDTRTMLLAENAVDEIRVGRICFDEATIKHDVKSKFDIVLDDVPLSYLMKNRSSYLDWNYNFKMDKEDSILLLCKFR